MVIAPKTIIVQEGDETKGIYFIQEGKVELYKTIEGSEFILEEVSRGQVIGLVAWNNNERHIITARARIQTVVIFYPLEVISPLFNDLNPILTLFIRAVTERFKNLNLQLVESKIKEKKLLISTGSPHQHAAQLAHLLSAFIRQGTIVHEENNIFPLKSFLINGEIILFKKFDYLEKIFNQFAVGGLIKVVFDKKYGNILFNPNSQFIEDFAVFSTNVSKKGLTAFMPLKFHKWIGGLIRLHKRYKEKEGVFPKKEFVLLVNKELGRTDGQEITTQLIGFHLIQEKGADQQSKMIFFNASQLQKKVIFESISRGIHEIDQKEEKKQEV